MRSHGRGREFVWTVVRLVKRGVCLCGATAVYDYVLLGKVYHADLSTLYSGLCVCGECGRINAVTVVLVKDDNPMGASRMIADLLDLSGQVN